MRLDHIAYRVENKQDAIDFITMSLGYIIDPDLPDGFDIQFEDNSKAQCSVLIHASDATEPEIFISEGTNNSIVDKWVKENGSGIHHLAYQVDSVEDTMRDWKDRGIEFTTDKPLVCEGLIQVFTKPSPLTGIIYELIEREGKGFCKDNVKDLMTSTVD
jgi:methylmalonyl-CoA/ethylmalonyl-CoA epimerase